MEFKYHLGYRTTNLVNGKFYYGIHSTNKEPGTDRYIGSGTAIRAAIRKYGRKNFRCEILHVFKSRTEASEWERNILTEDLINSPACYNLKSGGDSRELTGTGYFSTETLAKMSVSHKGIPRNPESTRKAIATRKINGYTMSEAGRQRLRESRLGKHLSPETIAKIRATQKARGPVSSRPDVRLKNSLAHKGKPGTCLGKIHIYRENKERCISPEQWPEFEQQGWIKGRLKSTVDKISSKTRGRESKLKGKPRTREIVLKIQNTKAARKDQYPSRKGRKRFKRGEERRWFMPEQFEQAFKDGWVALQPRKEWVQEEEQVLVTKFLQEADQHPVPRKQGQMLGNCLFIKEGTRKFFKPKEFKQKITEGWWPVRPAQIFWW